MKQLYGVVVGADESLDGVRVGRLTAVVGESQHAGYQQLPQPELLQEIVAHQRVVEELAWRYEVLPAQFGSLLPSEAQVQQLLTMHGETLEAAWRELVGLVQMDVRLVWDSVAVGKAIAAELGAGRQVQLAMAQRQNELEALVRVALEPVALGMVKNPQADENTAVSVGVLLPDEARAQLDERLLGLDGQLAGRGRLESVGPFWPHSFARLQVRLPKPTHIAHARELLGLGERTTKAEMRTAYRQHPHYTRPDKNSDLDSIVKMTELAQCYKMLREVADSQPGEICDLDEATMAETILLTVQKPHQ